MSSTSAEQQYTEWLQSFKKSHSNYKSIPHDTKLSLFIKSKTGKSFSSTQARDFVDWGFNNKFLSTKTINESVDAYEKNTKASNKVVKSFSNFKINPSNFTPRLTRHRHPTNWSGK